MSLARLRFWARNVAIPFEAAHTHSGAETHSGNETHSGTETFSGTLNCTGAFSGHTVEVQVTSGATVSLTEATHGGAVCVITSGGGSTSGVINLPDTSSTTSGTVITLVNALASQTSTVTITAGTTDDQINSIGTTKLLDMTTDSGVGASMSFVKYGSNKWYMCNCWAGVGLSTTGIFATT